MKTNPRILVAGSTGYLGKHIIEQLLFKKADFIAFARSKEKLLDIGLDESQVLLAQVTNPDEVRGVCDGVDVVISCLGITRQKDGLSYMDVDYQANLNLLEEAKRAGVKKFIYVSAFNAQKYPQVRLLSAKERFANILLKSNDIVPCVIRPNGFFSDITEIYNMAKAGRVYAFGDGNVRLNPIHGEDLANFCLEAIDKTETELAVGGPDVLSVNEIALLAFNSLHKPERVTHLPDSLRLLSLNIVKRLPEKWGGPAEFFLTMLESDAIAPQHGCHRLKGYFNELSENES
ncbi:SDR family oxidoreductase [Shewanella mesophila]|uniref:SDR family oxidoreductase n=1 Tax=Shewanella mesophila TaxID=2864208 RepID=UPI001C661AC6|nr:SDR family oxidoreductase [Shewanella mesophila]QYJ85684.1 SDR family oxidoreductase [Shewanella mesophila]